MKDKARCVVPGCTRMISTGNDQICGRCWRLVSPDLRLALHDIFELWKPLNDGDGWKAFLAWAWRKTEFMARHEASFERIQRRRQGAEYEPYSRDWNREMHERDLRLEAAL